jgi:hypothetical protein
MDVIEETGGMLPADLARHSVEVAGPSMYAKKIDHLPSAQAGYFTTVWLVKIPLNNPQSISGQQVNLFIHEFYSLKRDGEHSIFVSARTERGGENILNNFKIIASTHENRAAIYKILWAFVNRVQNLCKDFALPLAVKNIVNLANRVQEENVKTTASEESVETSSLELAAVLLEMDPAELAKTSVSKVTQMSTPFYVLVEEGKFYSSPDGTQVEYHPAREFTDLTAEEMENERRLLQIVKFHVVEWIAHYHTNVAQDIDLPDIGYWNKDGTYEPPDNDWRDMVARYGGDRAEGGLVPAHPDPVGEAMTAKDLAIQSVGLQIMAPTVHHTSDEGRDVRTYAWQNTAHDYTIKIRFTEHRSADRLLLSFSPWVETRPSVYDGEHGFTIYDGSISGKGDVYTRIWKALHDIKQAHDAGIDREELLDLAIQIFQKESMLSDQDQEKKGRPVI